MTEIYDKTTNAAVTMNPVLSWTNWSKMSLLAAVFLFACAHPLFLLVSEWGSHDFSHGILVPFISLYIVWVERRRFKNIPIKPGYAAGIAVIAAGAFILFLGKAGKLVLAEELSIIVIVPGLALLVLGRAYLRALAFPLGYLIFTVPVLNPVIDKIHWPFQIFTAKFAAAILPYCGVPVYQKMQFLELPNISLEVARECSGVNFMMSIYAVAVPLAYFTQRGWQRKTALMILAFIVGLATNGIRVTLIGIWTYFQLGDALHGPYHLLQGYFVAIAGFILLFLTSLALSRFRCRTVPEEVKEETADAAVGPDGGRIKNATWFIALALLLSIGGYMRFFNPAPISLKKGLSNLPLSAGDWRGIDVDGDKSPFKVTGADNELTRVYTKGSRREAILYIGYLKSQSQGKGLIYDYFDDYFKKIEEVEVPDLRGSIRLNRKLFRTGNRDYLALFWFALNGKTLTNTRRVKFETAYNGLVRGRTNGALVMVMSEVKSPGELEEVFHDETTLIQALKPQLRDYLP